MNLSDYINPELVFPDVEATDKTRLLDFLLGRIAASRHFLAQTDEVQAQISDAVLERESYGSTSIGNGVLFPHARVPGFTGLLVAFARCTRPLDTPTVDGEPVSLVCLAIVPAQRPTLALKVVSAFARFFKDPAARAFLRTAATPDDIHNYIRAHDVAIGATVLARDLCQPYPWTAHPDTPVREVARQILRNFLAAVAVVGEDGRLLGEINCEQLFRSGLPNFFHQLRSVSFVRDFDPFEQYFLDEARATAKDIMDADASRLPEDGTLMEVVHTLAVKHRAVVHVVDPDGRATGFIDNASVLNRVLSP